MRGANSIDLCDKARRQGTRDRNGAWALEESRRSVRQTSRLVVELLSHTATFSVGTAECL
jgi:hypothetical protein